MITLTIGGRFIIGELDEKKKQEITDFQTFRRFFVFCAFFMATRDKISSIASMTGLEIITGASFIDSTSISKI